MGVNGNANSSEVLLQDGGTQPASTSGRWITPLGSGRNAIYNSTSTPHTVTLGVTV